MPLPDHITHIRRYPVTPRLGRHLVLDSRSLDYLVEATTRRQFKATAWMPRIGILDQENLVRQGIHTSAIFPGMPDYDSLGSCTGNGGTYYLSAMLHPEMLDAIRLDTTSTVHAEQFAIRFYAGATSRDQWTDQQMPPTDSGSSGLGLARYAKSMRWIRGYRHATSAQAVVTALQTGPVLLGVPWYQAWFEPDSRGFVDADPRWAGSGIAGGHEIYGGVLESVAQDAHGSVIPERTVLAFPNSWGRTWGDDGWGRMRLSTYVRLRQQIDAVQFRLAA